MDKKTKEIVNEAEGSILRDINFLIRVRVQDEFKAMYEGYLK